MDSGDGPGATSTRRVVSRARRVDCAVTAALEDSAGPRVAWFPPDGPAVAGRGAAAAVSVDGSDRFERVSRRATTLLANADVDGPGDLRLFGGFSFGEHHEARAPWRGFPSAYFVLPRVQVTRRDSETWLRVTATGPDAERAADEALADAAATVESVEPSTGGPPGVSATRRTPDRERWRRQVGEAVARIRDGDLQKVVLASALRATLREPFSLSTAMTRLSRDAENCYRFAVDPGSGASFFGATPELLVRKRGGDLETEALAGSVARGDTPTADRSLAADLRASEKDQHEHRLVVDAIRDQLEPVSTRVSVGSQSIRTLDSVQHLQTPIAADVAPSRHVLEFVSRLHPTPAVGGYPPAAAQRAIRDAESFERGWYAAPVGWLGADGDGAFAVGIRSGVAAGRTATLFAGNGIVADSDPDAEWEEVQLKFRPMLDHLR